MTKVADMYHRLGMKQPQIAAQLHLSQPRVSRLLKEAAQVGVVRTVVTQPPGVHTDLEEELQRRYGLLDAVVVDTTDAPTDVVARLGTSAAAYLDVTLTGADTIGVSSWSGTLLAAIDALEPKHGRVADYVVQMIGGAGSADVQLRATRLTGRLADLTRARAVYISAPGFVSTAAVRRAIVEDASLQDISALWDKLTLALVGIGSPSPLLGLAGKGLTQEEQQELQSLGAVGEVCLRFFDDSGGLVQSSLDQRVVGISPAQLLRIPRRVAVAGGPEKVEAVRGAVLGGWANILITDLVTATTLLADVPDGADPSPTRHGR